MKRMKVLIGKRRVMVIATLAILVLAAAALAASSASFTSTSANPGNIFTAGTLKSTSTGVVMNITKLKPDNQWVTAGTITVTNTGDVNGVFSLASAITADTVGLGHTGHLSDVLEVRVTDPDAATPLVWTGKIKEMPASVAAGTINGGVANTYTFEVRFPNGTTSYTEDGGDNAFQDASMTVTFNWTAVND